MEFRFTAVRKIKCVFGVDEEGVPYKEITKVISVPDRSTKNYYDATTIGKALWDAGNKMNPKMAPLRVISIK